MVYSAGLPGIMIITAIVSKANCSIAPDDMSCMSNLVSLAQYKVCLVSVEC